MEKKIFIVALLQSATPWITSEHCNRALGNQELQGKMEMEILKQVKDSNMLPKARRKAGQLEKDGLKVLWDS